MQNIPGLRFCKVVSIKDETGRGMITVEMGNTAEQARAFPLLPKLFYGKPKVGEGVFVFFTNAADTTSQAYYIGPVISQEHEVNMDSFDQNSSQRGSEIHPDVNPETRAKVEPLIPKDNEVWVRGRKDAELQITDEDINLRAGVRLTMPQTAGNPWGLFQNTTHPSFLKLRYHSTPIAGGQKSTATIVADKIAFINKNSQLGINDPEVKGDTLIDDKVLETFINQAEKVPYGKKLVELLKLIIKAIITHTHPYVMVPPVNTIMGQLEAQKVNLLDNEKLLSDTIRFN